MRWREGRRPGRRLPTELRASGASEASIRSLRGPTAPLHAQAFSGPKEERPEAPLSCPCGLGEVEALRPKGGVAGALRPTPGERLVWRNPRPPGTTAVFQTRSLLCRRVLVRLQAPLLKTDLEGTTWACRAPRPPISLHRFFLLYPRQRGAQPSGRRGLAPHRQAGKPGLTHIHYVR